MNIIDIILLLVVLIPGAWTGFRKGFIYQAVTLIALIVGAWISFHFATSLGSFLGGFVNASPKILKALSYLIIFVVVYFLLYLVSKLVLRIIRIHLGGWVDRLLGIILGLFKAAIIGALLIMLFDTINSLTGLVSKGTLDSSKVYVALQNFGHNVFPYLKTLFVR